MKVIVSLTNKHGKSKKYPDICLLEVSSGFWRGWGSKIKPIPTEHCRLNVPLSGIASLVAYKDGLIFFTDNYKVGWLNKQYQVEEVWTIPIKHPHSVVCIDDVLYIASTSRDCVIKSVPFKDRHEVFWKDNTGRQDTIHLNSVAHRDGEFFVTAFGPRKEFWHSAESGYVKNITTGEMVETDLKQPHTIINVKGELYFCNSATSEVCKVGDSDRLVVDPHSYVRGMAFTDKMLAVATSKGRKKSKSTGKDLITNFTDPGNPTGQCALHFFERAYKLSDYKLIRSVNLDDYGSEIFDVCQRKV